MKKLLLVFVLINLLFSCKPKTQYHYYPSGEVSEKREFHQKNDTSSYLLTEYYPNKQIKMQGNVINGLREGIWHEYYSDGDTIWSGEYNNYGRKAIENFVYPKFLFSDTLLIVGKPVYLRITTKGVHRKDRTDFLSNIEFNMNKEDSNLNNYDYCIIPEDSGYIHIWVLTTKLNPLEVIETVDSFYVYPAKNDILHD